MRLLNREAHRRAAVRELPAAQLRKIQRASLQRAVRREHGHRPGPGDAWAGSRDYRARWTLVIEDPQIPHDLALWLVDTTRLGGTLRISVDGEHMAEVELPLGATRGSREGDANVPGTALMPSYHELEIPQRMLPVGECEIEFHLAEGGWVAWDAIGVFARE